VPILCGHNRKINSSFFNKPVYEAWGKLWLPVDKVADRTSRDSGTDPYCYIVRASDSREPVM
jgi:hypothetical protein